MSKKKYKIILQEDDCAPDAFEYFEKEFKKKVGMDVKQFKQKAKMIDNDDTIIYELDNFRLKNEIGIHTLQRDLSEEISDWKSKKDNERYL